MPKAIPANLLAEINRGAQTITELILIIGRYNHLLGFTRYARGIKLGDYYFHSRPGMMVTRTAANIALAVDNSEAQGGLMPGIVTRQDIRGGKFVGARYQRMMIDYEHLEWGSYTFQSGFLGSVSLADNAFKAELLSLTKALQQPVGEVISAGCRVEVVGDARCKLDLENGTHPGVLRPYKASGLTVSGVSGVLGFTAEFGSSYPSGFFDNGVLTWLTGNNAAMRMEVKSYTQQTATRGRFVMQEPMGYPIKLGDTLKVYWGCDRTFARCKTVGNVVNMRAEPYLIGDTELYRNVS